MSETLEGTMTLLELEQLLKECLYTEFFQIKYLVKGTPIFEVWGEMTTEAEEKQQIYIVAPEFEHVERLKISLLVFTWTHVLTARFRDVIKKDGLFFINFYDSIVAFSFGTADRHPQNPRSFINQTGVYITYKDIAMDEIASCLENRFAFNLNTYKRFNFIIM